VEVNGPGHSVDERIATKPTEDSYLSLQTGFVTTRKE
jgi:hypothetical protein